jgi:type II secretory ATPase GspE/PulE/Tfp pilus assembly ATPase PilB-like protein
MASFPVSRPWNGFCRNNGIILVSGPTGSGKSTLYAALNCLTSG